MFVLGTYLNRFLSLLEAEDEAQLVPEAREEGRVGVALAARRRPRQVAARQRDAQRAAHDQHQEQPEEVLDPQLGTLAVFYGLWKQYWLSDAGVFKNRLGISI